MGYSPLPITAISERLLRNWVRCRRRAWLDRHGDGEERLWTAHRTLQLNNQYRIFNELLTKKPSRGIEACKRGEPAVIGIRFKANFGPNNQIIEVHPPLLQRIKGKSCWGNFAYRPVIAQQGKRLTREHRLTLALMCLLVESNQKSSITNGLAVAKTQQGLTFRKVSLTSGIKSQLFESLQKLNQDLEKDHPPPITAERKKCTLCSWRGICNAEASREGHLSEVSGIGTSRRQMLQEAGINGLEELASTDHFYLETYLKRFGDQHSGAAKKLIAQAKAQRDGLVDRFNNSPALPELSKAPGVLIYDIESDPDERQDFLHGFLRINRNTKGEWDLANAIYHPILIVNKNDNSIAWRRIRKKLSNYPQWPILHYGETESIAIYRLAKREGADEKELLNLKKRLFDLHEIIKSRWYLPLNSYGLKKVASWLGFKWRKTGVEGANALLWWRQWEELRINKKDKLNPLKNIFEYNHDDCLATWQVAKWILKQDQSNPL